MAKAKKEVENVEVKADKLPQLINCTKAGHPLQYNVEQRFESIQANFEVLWAYLNK
jgi:hypothetical protein